MVYFLLTLTKILSDCRTSVNTMKMIHEIDGEEFEYIVSDKDKVGYLDEYQKKGLTVFRDEKADRYYVYIDGYNFRIDNKDAFDTFFKDHKKYTKHRKTYVVQSIFHGQIPEMQQFPSATIQRIDQLSKVVGETLLQNGKPDVNSLNAVDSFLNCQVASWAFRKKYFADFVALVGETLIQKFGKHCSWEMQLYEDGVTWQPDVFYDRNWLGIGATLYDNLRDASNKQPVYSTFNTIDLIIHTTLRGVTQHDK